jgi:Zincin-like metallopeptidase
MMSLILLLKNILISLLWRKGMQETFAPTQYALNDLCFIEAFQSDPKGACENIIQSMQDIPVIKKVYDEDPHYLIEKDIIVLPEVYEDVFDSFRVTFFGMIRSTGNKKRVFRDLIAMRFMPSCEIAIVEEVICEIGSLYLQAYGGIVSKYFFNSMAYIQHWLCLAEEERQWGMLNYAIDEARKACDYILRDNPIKSLVVLT